MSGQSRVVSFFVEPESLPVVAQAIEDQVLARFSALPNFVGLVCLTSQRGARAEVVGISLWSGDLDPSEEASEVLRTGVSQLTGTIPSRRSYEILRARVLDADGAVCVDMP